MSESVYSEFWAKTRLEECVEILDSQRIPVNNSERQKRIEGKSEEELFPYYGATGEVGKIDDYLFDEELVALGEDGVPFLDSMKNKAYMLHGKTWVNNHAHVLRAITGLCTNKIILHYLNQFDYQGYVNGGTRLKLTQANMRKIPFLLPPLAEQKEIARQLDDLLARVDTLKTRLDTIPAILKRFRQATLAAAVSGKLTEEWRGRSTGDSLFKPNAPSLKQFRGKPLEDLPENWQWLPFDAVAKIASNLQSPKDTPEAIHIAPNHIESGTGRLLEYTTVSKDNVTSPKHRFAAHQILYSKIRPYLNKVVLVSFSGLCSADMYPIDPKIDRNYLLRWMLTPRFSDWASSAGSRSVLPKLNQKGLSQIPVPVPPLAEQTEIVRRVEELFAFADQIEQRVRDAQARAEKLTQSVLAKAFRGDLTESWRAAHPDLVTGQNSAEALLERIKEERRQVKPKGRNGREKGKKNEC